MEPFAARDVGSSPTREADFCFHRKQTERKMADAKGRPPRLSQDLTEKQNLKLQRLVPWGMRRRVFSRIIDQLIEMLEGEDEESRTQILGAIIKEQIVLTPKPNPENEQSGRHQDEHNGDSRTGGQEPNQAVPTKSSDEGIGKEGREEKAKEKEKG